MSSWNRILRFDEVSSTNDLAKDMGKRGESEGLVVVAKRQTCGRGRMGRSWISPPGGLYVSFLLRPPGSAEDALRLTVHACVPVAKAIRQVTGLTPKLKWPNDVLIEGKKAAGILVEGVFKGGSLEMVVLGVGINVNTDVRELPPDATSLSQEKNGVIDEERMLSTLLLEIDSFYEKLKKDEVDEDEYKAMSCVLGRQIEAVVGRETFRGKALYLQRDGALIMKSDEGLVLRLAHVNETSIKVTKEEENDSKSLRKN
ncbi:MAG: biotin--[acetyl-CoA-carboxylase] ligase [Methanomassiliicoccales archaeon]